MYILARRTGIKMPRLAFFYPYNTYVYHDIKKTIQTYKNTQKNWFKYLYFQKKKNIYNNSITNKKQLLNLKGLHLIKLVYYVIATASL